MTNFVGIFHILCFVENECWRQSKKVTKFVTIFHNWACEHVSKHFVVLKWGSWGKNFVQIGETISKQFFWIHNSHFEPIIHNLRYILWKTMDEMDRMVRPNLVRALVCNIGSFQGIQIVGVQSIGQFSISFYILSPTLSQNFYRVRQLQ